MFSEGKNVSNMTSGCFRILQDKNIDFFTCIMKVLCTSLFSYLNTSTSPTGIVKKSLNDDNHDAGSTGRGMF